MPKSTKTKKHQSFTLIELITVLAIISILITSLIAIIKPREILKKERPIAVHFLKQKNR